MCQRSIQARRSARRYSRFIRRHSSHRYPQSLMLLPRPLCLGRYGLLRGLAASQSRWRCWLVPPGLSLLIPLGLLLPQRGGHQHLQHMQGPGGQVHPHMGERRSVLIPKAALLAGAESQITLCRDAVISIRC